MKDGSGAAKYPTFLKIAIFCKFVFFATTPAVPGALLEPNPPSLIFKVEASALLSVPKPNVADEFAQLPKKRSGKPCQPSGSQDSLLNFKCKNPPSFGGARNRSLSR